MSLLIDWAMMGKHGLLPAAYQQVEYLESLYNTGYVEIPYNPQLGDGMSIVVEYLSSEGVATAQAFHVGPSSGVRFCLNCQFPIQYTINMSSSPRTPYRQVVTGVWYKISMDGDGLSTAIDVATGSTLGTVSVAQSEVPVGDNIWLFKPHGTTRNKEMRIGEVVVTRGGADLLHLWPCYRKADSVMGYYDTVGKTFYAVIGTFAKGADV